MDVSSVPSVLCVISYTDIGLMQKFPAGAILLQHVIITHYIKQC